MATARYAVRLLVAGVLDVLYDGRRRGEGRYGGERHHRVREGAHVHLHTPQPFRAPHLYVILRPTSTSQPISPSTSAKRRSPCDEPAPRPGIPTLPPVTAAAAMKYEAPEASGSISYSRASYDRGLNGEPPPALYLDLHPECPHHLRRDADVGPLIPASRPPASPAPWRTARPSAARSRTGYCSWPPRTPHRPSAEAPAAHDQGKPPSSSAYSTTAPSPRIASTRSPTGRSRILGTPSTTVRPLPQRERRRQKPRHRPRVPHEQLYVPLGIMPLCPVMRRLSGVPSARTAKPRRTRACRSQ